MKSTESQSCCCPGDCTSPEIAVSDGTKPQFLRYLLLGFPLLVAWWLIYRNLAPFSKFFVYDLLQLSTDSHFSHALEFFVYDTPKVLMLLTLVVFGVGIVRSFFTAERTRRILAGKRESAGNVLAALLGIVTPFCTCSAIPLRA